MDTKTILKWGVIGLVAYFAFKMISNAVASADYTPGDNGLVSPSWAAPIWYGGPVTGWYAPWQRPYRPKRGR